MAGKTLLVAVLVAGCATSSSPPTPLRKTLEQRQQEAFERHLAPLEKWMNGIQETNKCYQLAEKNPQAVQPCLDQAPPPESYLPQDLKKGETFSEYLERSKDEWEEKECFYKGLMDARYIGENQRIEDQCKRDLEIKRLRKAIEKLNRQKQQ